MAVAVVTAESANLVAGGSYDVPAVGDITDGLLVLTGAMRLVNASLDPVISQIDIAGDVSTDDSNFSFATFGTSKLGLMFSHWIEADFPAEGSGTLNAAWVTAPNDNVNGRLVALSGVDQSTVTNASNDESFSSATPAGVAATMLANGLALYEVVSTTTPTTPAGWTEEMAPVSVGGIWRAVYSRTNTVEETVTVTSITTSAIGYHKVVTYNPSAAGTDVAGVTDNFTLTTYAATVSVGNAVSATKAALSLSTYQASIESGTVSVPPNLRRSKQNRNLILSI